MLKSGKFLKYFRVHSTQIDIFKKGWIYINLEQVRMIV